MNIIFLTDQHFLHGGVEKVLSQKANYLADIMGDTVTVVTYRQQKNKPVYELSAKIKVVDLEVNYNIVKSYFQPSNLKKIPHHVLALKELLQKIKPDVIVSSNFGPDFYFLPFLEKHIPKIKEFHSSRYFYKQSASSLKIKFLQKINNYIENKYHQLVVLNDSELTFYKTKKISVISNPAEESTKRANYFSKKIIAAGRISPVKNFGDLIDSFSRLSNLFPDWELHFFGEDYLGTQQKLLIKINEYNLQNRIKFKGSVRDLKEEMQHYSIYAMTSETECFPMVLLEALSIGLPVLSYDAPTGPKHILKNEEDSFLVPYKNLDIFTERLKVMMHSQDLRHEMGLKGNENVQRFNIEKVMQHWKNLFDSLV